MGPCSTKTLGALALALLPCGCTPDFAPEWLIKDLRILAIRAEPPEVLLPAGSTDFPPVQVEALSVDPTAPQAEVDWELIGCSNEETRCDLATYRKVVGFGHGRLDTVQCEVRLPIDLYQAALAADPLRGLGGVAVMLQLSVRREGQEAIAVKRLVYGTPTPPAKTPNRNPSLIVTADEQPPPSSWTIDAGRKVVLRPVSLPTDKEHYWVATYSGGSRELDEFLSYSFFTTAGALSDAQTGGRPIAFIENKKTTDLSSEWTAPTSAGPVTLWIVVRDDRGGAGWTGLTATIL